MKLVTILEWPLAGLRAALVLSAAIAYAGQPGDSGAPLPVPSPCSLLSSVEIGAVSGVAVDEGAALFSNGSTVGCSFAHRGGGRILVFIRSLPNGEWAAAQVERMRRGVSYGSYREVGAVGERAFLLNRDAVAVLCVFQRPLYLQISVLGIRKRPASAVLEILARSALRRLASVTPKGDPTARAGLVAPPATR